MSRHLPERALIPFMVTIGPGVYRTSQTCHLHASAPELTLPLEAWPRQGGIHPEEIIEKGPCLPS